MRTSPAALLPLAVLFIALLGACSGEALPEASLDPDEAPASGPRLVTLAPHLAELVYAIGAGDRLVGVSAWSDYPPEVTELPVIGDAFGLDLERLRLLQPDLLLAWESGIPAHTVDELRQAGYAVELVRTRGLGDIAPALVRIGQLTGRAEQAEMIAATFDAEMQALGRRYADRAELRVFYQVSSRPVYTINAEHYLSAVIEICGGRNVFSDLPDLAPAVDVEAVVTRDPEVILAAGEEGDAVFVPWDRWPGISANRHDNRFLVPAELITRATPRLAEGAAAVCDALQIARDRIAADDS